MSASPVLLALHAEIAAEGGLLAQVLVPESAVAPEAACSPSGPASGAPASDESALPPALCAAAGPLAAAAPEEYAVVVEAIREGYLLHYGAQSSPARRPRVLAPEDPDLALLAGDRLYALGLARLAALGDLAAVAALAEVIALCAQAHAAQDADLADAVWEAGAVQVGWGDDPALQAARDLARAADPGAAHALRAAARQVRAELVRPR